MTPLAVQQRVVLLDQNLRIEAREVRDDLLEDRISRIIGGRDTEPDGELPPRVGEAECRREAFVEPSLNALDGPNYGNVRDFILSQ